VPPSPSLPYLPFFEEEMTDGRKAGRASKTTLPPPPLSSRYGSATGHNVGLDLKQHQHQQQQKLANFKSLPEG